MGRTGRSAVATGLVVLLSSGCASTPRVTTYGRHVTVIQEGAEDKVEGELVTVDSERLWVEESEGLVEVPLPTVREVRVKRHGLDGGAALKWSVLGGLVTGGLLAGACSSVEDAENCGAVGLAVGGLWVVVGLLSAPSMEASSRLDLWNPTPEQLRDFARLPQGWPESLRLPTLAPPAPDSGVKDGNEEPHSSKREP